MQRAIPTSPIPTIQHLQFTAHSNTLFPLQKLNEEEYAGEGQEIECGCCCCEYPFEKMVQCAEGHLFCFACLKRRVEESTFGASSAGGSLPCMDTDGCQAEFPHAEVCFLICSMRTLRTTRTTAPKARASGRYDFFSWIVLSCNRQVRPSANSPFVSKPHARFNFHHICM